MVGVIAHYKMDDNAANSVVIDQTGNHNGNYKDTTGNINTNTGTSTAKIGRGLDFDGTDEYIEIPDHADFTPILTPFSISVWVYMHSAVDFDLMSKGSLGVDLEWYLVVGNDSKILWLLFHQSTSEYIYVKYDTVLTSYVNNWIHLAATYDGGTSVTGLKIYLNAVQVNDITDASGSFAGIEAKGHAVWVGWVQGGYADGIIDNLMFFEREISLLEIQRQYDLYKISRGRNRDRNRSTRNYW